MKTSTSMLSACLVFLPTQTVCASDRDWTGGAEDLGDHSAWFDANNWAPIAWDEAGPIYTLPQDDDQVAIEQAYDEEYAINYSRTEENTRLKDLLVQNGMILNINDTHTAWDNGPAKGFWVLDNEVIGKTGPGTVNQNAGFHTVWSDFEHPGLGNLWLGPGDGFAFGTGTYNLNAGILEAYSQIIGGTEGTSWESYDDGAGEGYFVQAAGTENHAGGLWLGITHYSYGSYTMDGGTLRVDQWETIGGRGEGCFTQAGGTHEITNDYGGSAGFIMIGDAATGSYTLHEGEFIVHSSDSGTNPGYLTGMVIGNQADGSFDQLGGSVLIDHDLIVGHLDPTEPIFQMGNGAYNLTDGTLDTRGNEFLGMKGTGTFIHDGGTHAVGATLYQGYADSGTGNYILNDGDLSAATSIDVGVNGTGTLTQNGGTITVGIAGAQTEVNQVSVNTGAGSGTYDLNDGTVNAYAIHNRGYFNFHGGEVQANFYNALSGQTLMQATNPGDTLTLPNSTTNDGALDIIDSTVVFAGPILNRAGATMHVMNGTVTFGGPFINDGTFISDPSAFDFVGDVTIGTDGYFSAAAGDTYRFHGGFRSSSINPLWNTSGATLAFIGAATHTMELAGANSVNWDILWLDTDAVIDYVGLGELRVNSIVLPGGDLTQLAHIDGDLKISFGLIQKPNAAGGFDTVSFDPSKLPENIIPDPITTWLLANGFPSDANLQLDPNGDGVCLLMAYALKLDPKLNLSDCMPRPVIAANQMSLTFYAGSAGVTYTVETSTDLLTWSTQGVTITNAGQSRTATVATGATSRFMRIVAEH